MLLIEIHLIDAFNCTLRTIINNYSKVLELNASLRAALAINISYSASACR